MLVASDLGLLLVVGGLLDLVASLCGFGWVRCFRWLSYLGLIV